MSSDVKVDLYMGTATFFVNVSSEASKTTYRGQFKVKTLLSALDFINADAYFRELLGKFNPEYANEAVSQLCYAYAQLKYRVMESPEWFNDSVSGVGGGNLESNVVFYILEQCVKAEQEYRDQIEKKYAKAKGEVKKTIDETEKKPDEDDDEWDD